MSRHGDKPRVGVAVITCDRSRELALTLAKLAALPERPPVVVVDNGSDSEIEAPSPTVRVVHVGRNLGAAGRNLAVRSLDTPYVAFCDDDSWWEPGALERAADILDTQPRLGLIAARILTGPEESEDAASRDMSASPLGPAGAVPGTAVIGFVACGAVVRRSAFLEVGGFNPRYSVGGEERLLATDLRAAGWSLAYVPEIVAHHHPPGGSRPQRVAHTVRNDLWFTWLRRPLPVALRATAKAVWRALGDASWRAGLVSALAGARWVARERRPVSDEVERELRLVA